ncbi:hypothetical protein A9Q91_03335 [Candidatus Gracilibacteria bacterium 28_42_T64]|nr:hypothetical protein A9Q91_03335 [Candidatus Gracilibacteria bacterium 28_42_T64]
MISSYIILLILAILPLVYKYSFWLYVIQLKEYRWDRFNEYLHTPQGKNAVFNFWFLLEVPFFLMTIILYFNPVFEYILYNLVFYFLVLWNIFVLGKIFRKKLTLPKKTGRLLTIAFVLLVGISFDFAFILNNELFKFFYSYLFILFLIPVGIIFAIIFVLHPVVSYKKNKLINRASNKSKNNDHTIKIGITGSYGKSSVKEFLCSILENEGNLLKTPENINTELGVSSIILNELSEDNDYFVAEMGAYRIGEIETLGDIVNHKYGFLTAIGTQHLGLFGGIKNTIQAKCEIANKVSENKGILYVNYDNQDIRNIKFDENLSVVSYGFYKHTDAHASNINIVKAVSSFDFHYKGEKYTFETNLVGIHNITNLSGVIACCIDLGISIENMKKYLLNIKSPKSTLDITHNKNGSIYIDDSYNLSEDSLFSGLNVLSSFEGDTILILDDILELGKESAYIHNSIGKRIAQTHSLAGIYYVGVNYKKDFINGLIDGGYSEEKILKNLKNINEKSVMLFEGRRSAKYISK